MKRLVQLLPLSALILLPVKGVQAETPKDPIYVKTSNGWNAAYAHGNEYAEFRLTGNSAKLRDAYHILLQKNVGMMVSFVDKKELQNDSDLLSVHAVPGFCQLTKELGGALTEDQIYAEDTLGKPWKARQNSSYSGIVKWISPTRFVVSEESQWQVKERDPSATLGQYGEAEKLEDESNDSAALYHGKESQTLTCSTPRIHLCISRWQKKPIRNATRSSAPTASHVCPSIPPSAPAPRKCSESKDSRNSLRRS